ncbi:MAG: hypothetical protein GTN36_04035 [Candidatus Aenigmarchaeota archaeon]|nr:hypothetical protein [Candidatus Aenigmarchaeota archaeon]
MKSQAAFEYLMIFSIVIALVLVLVAYALQITERNKEEIRISNAIAASHEIVDTANIVNTQGKPTSLTLTSVYIPEGVESITINGKTVLMKVRVAGGITDIFATSKADLQGSISNTQGIKRVKIKAEDNYVNITEV